MSGMEDTCPVQTQYALITILECDTKAAYENLRHLLQPKPVKAKAPESPLMDAQTFNRNPKNHFLTPKQPK